MKQLISTNANTATISDVPFIKWQTYTGENLNLTINSKSSVNVNLKTFKIPNTQTTFTAEDKAILAIYVMNTSPNSNNPNVKANGWFRGASDDIKNEVQVSFFNDSSTNITGLAGIQIGVYYVDGKYVQQGT